MQILASANKPIHEWKPEDIIDTIPQTILTNLEIKGVPMERKNILYQDDLDTSIQTLVNELAKEGVLGG
jgi:hypothetical protein